MRIRWTEPAAGDSKSATTSKNITTKTRLAALRLSSANASASSLSKDRKAVRRGTREMMIAGLPYRIKNDAIETLRILHGAQERI
jgi:hypothetical protein